jgi:hypothetical protein
MAYIDCTRIHREKEESGDSYIGVSGNKKSFCIKKKDSNGNEIGIFEHAVFSKIDLENEVIRLQKDVDLVNGLISELYT